MRRSSVLLSIAVAVLAFAPAASAEWFLDGYIGAAVTQNDKITFTTFGTEETQDVTYSASPVFGVRAGHWFDAIPWLGLAVDASYFRVSRDSHIFPLSGLVMARYGFLRDDEFREGRLQPYAGIGPGLFISKIDGSLGFNDASDTSTDLGLDLRLGVAYAFERNWFGFLEYRYTHVSPSFRIETFEGKTPADTKFDTHHISVGVSYRF
ncbi:MAG: outer membrane protein [Candidatus Limnocylindria bacterium]